MWPTLITVGPFSLHSFGAMLFLGLFFGGFKLWQKAKETGWEEAAVMDSWLFSGVGAIVAGRAGYILGHWAVFENSWYKMMFLTKFPGLSGVGAWLGGITVLFICGWRRRWDKFAWLEAIVPALLIFEIFVHLGEFLAGGGLGKTAPAGFGLVFPGVEGPRWPVQLIWAAALLAAYWLIGRWEKHYRSYNFKPGTLLAAYLLILGGLTVGLSWLEIQSRQWWGAGLMAAGGLILGLRSGITLKIPGNLPAPKFKAPKPKRKKRGFDYV